MSGATLTFFLLSADVHDIKFVINFDFPNNTEDYVHRIGRTARAEQTGTAYSFFTSSNAKQARELIDILKEAKQNVPPRLYHMLELSKQMHMAKCELISSYLLQNGSILLKILLTSKISSQVMFHLCLSVCSAYAPILVYTDVSTAVSILVHCELCVAFCVPLQHDSVTESVTISAATKIEAV